MKRSVLPVQQRLDVGNWDDAADTVKKKGLRNVKSFFPNSSVADRIQMIHMQTSVKLLWWMQLNYRLGGYAPYGFGTHALVP